MILAIFLCGSDYKKQLKKYKELLDVGVITQEEFEEKKKQLFLMVWEDFLSVRLMITLRYLTRMESNIHVLKVSIYRLR